MLNMAFDMRFAVMFAVRRGWSSIKQGRVAIRALAQKQKIDFSFRVFRAKCAENLENLSPEGSNCRFGLPIGCTLAHKEALKKVREQNMGTTEGVGGTYPGGYLHMHVLPIYYTYAKRGV